MSKHSASEAARVRVREVEQKRELRMAAWSLTRNEGIREGLMMAIGAANNLSLYDARTPGDAIRERGNRHFGDSDWQTKPRAQ